MNNKLPKAMNTEGKRSSSSSHSNSPPFSFVLKKGRENSICCICYWLHQS